MQLVDEQDDLPVGLLDFLQDRLQPLLEFAAELCAGNERAHIERNDLLVLQSFGDIAANDPLRQPLGDRGLADARLADQDRVVLGSAREHLDDPANLLIAADHRIELAVLSRRGQVATVFFERRVCALRIRRRHTLRAADALEQLEDAIAGQATLGQKPRRLALRRQYAEQQVLGADVFVPKLARLLLGGVEHLARRAGDGRFGAVLERRQCTESALIGARSGREGRPAP